MKKVGVTVIKRSISEEDFALIRAKHKTHGRNWIHYLIETSAAERADMDALLPEGSDAKWPMTMSAHHGFGTHIRNILRSDNGAGIRDEDLPPAPYEDGSMQRNWDDHYLAFIEAAAGLGWLACR